MALEKFTGALASVNASITRHVVGNVGYAFGCTNRLLQRVLPAQVTAVATPILFAAVSGAALHYADKAWTPVVAASANSAAPASCCSGYFKTAYALALVAASTFINFGLVGIYTGGATPLAFLAAAGTVAYASRGYLTAQAVKGYNAVLPYIKKAEQSAEQVVLADAEKDAAAAEAALNNIKDRLAELPALIEAARTALSAELEKLDQLVVKPAEEAVAKYTKQLAKQNAAWTSYTAGDIPGTKKLLEQAQADLDKATLPAQPARKAHDDLVAEELKLKQDLPNLQKNVEEKKKIVEKLKVPAPKEVPAPAPAPVAKEAPAPAPVAAPKEAPAPAPKAPVAKEAPAPVPAPAPKAAPAPKEAAEETPAVPAPDTK